MRSFLAILALLFLFNPCLAEEKTSHAVGQTRLAQNGSYMLTIFVSKNDRSIQGALVQVFNSTKKPFFDRNYNFHLQTCQSTYEGMLLKHHKTYLQLVLTQESNYLRPT